MHLGTVSWCVQSLQRGPIRALSDVGLNQADDATWSCEASRKPSPGNDGPDRSGVAASVVGSCPGTPGSCDSSSQPQGQGFAMETGA